MMYYVYGVTLPMQVVPSPVYPWLHVQVKFPGLLIHRAFGSQLLVLLLLHSSISACYIIISIGNHMLLCAIWV